MIERRSTEMPPVQERLRLSPLAMGERHNLLIHLADDGLGFPLHVPIIVVRGRHEGPTFGLLAGLHGNELNGIWTVHALMDQLNPESLHGSVVAVVVANAPGLVRRQRQFSDGHDLNRVFPGRDPGSPSQIWAHRLRKRIVRKFDYLLDLHTAGAGRLNCVYARVDLEDAASSAMARALAPQLIVHKPPGDRSLRAWASSHGIPAVTLEIGDPQRRQGELVTLTVHGARQALHWAGILPGAPEQHAYASERECRRSRWIFTRRGGLLDVFPEVGTRVRKGEHVGELRDVFGRMIETYEAPDDAWVVGKTADPIAPSGGRVIHLAYQGVDPDEPVQTGP